MIDKEMLLKKRIELNHLDDYDVDLDEQQIEDLHIKLVILN